MHLKDPDSMAKAYELNGADLGGYILYVDEAKPRPGNNRDVRREERLCTP